MDHDPIGEWREWIGRPNPFGIPLLLVFLALFSSVVLSPFLEEGGTILLDGGGKVGSREYDEDIERLTNPISRATYVFGDIYCHQSPDRSYDLNGNQMPVCARDVGIFAGLVIGALIGMMLTRRFPIILLVIALAPMVLDGGIQMLTAYESLNLLRILTGLMAGIGVGIWTNKSTSETLSILFYRREKR